MKLIPGPRNEELIAKIREARKAEDFDGIIGNIAPTSSELYDALYYACDCGDIMLEDQRRYLEWLLFEEETDHYVERMLADCEHLAGMR